MEQNATETDLCRPQTHLLYVQHPGHVGALAYIHVTDLSLEFLMGRALDNAMLNVGLKDVARGKIHTLSPQRDILKPTI